MPGAVLPLYSGLGATGKGSALFAYFLIDFMKISKAWEYFHEQHPFELKIFKKGIFWILLDHEAFFVAKYLSMKLTPHDKQHIKVGFPMSSQLRRLDEFKKK